MNYTSQAFHLIWDNPVSRQVILDEFMSRVSARATRQDIDEWLEHLDEYHLGIAFVLIVIGQLDLKLVHWKRVTDFLCDCFYASRDASRLPDPPSDTAWDCADGEPGTLVLYPQRDRIIKRSVPLLLLPLEELLLECAKKHEYKAERMVYRGAVWDLHQLLARGEVFTGPVEMYEGEPSRAHVNVARLWAERKNEISIATGYGLSQDGIWRQHSFALRNRPEPGQAHIIETTLQRELYFGYVLTPEESEWFYQVQIGT